MWNYTAQKIQIFSTTKRGVTKGLTLLAKSAKWGDLQNYDICVNKIQTDLSDNMSIEYSVTPQPPAVLDNEIIGKWEQSGFTRQSLFLLFEGLDPFEEQRKSKKE